MSEQVNSSQFGEQLSALMDGELARDELRFLLRRVDSDAQLAQTWSRFQIARSVLRHQITATVRMDFADSLMQRIEQESIASVPRRRGATLVRWAGGGAIAAAVAVVALVSTRPAGEMQSSGAMVATAAPTAVPTAIQDTRINVSPQGPAMLNFVDYAQPASFDLRRRYETNSMDSANPAMPYVLMNVPRLQQQAAIEHPGNPQK
jgi:sigma-E factor negative regulatory protein RseA